MIFEETETGILVVIKQERLICQDAFFGPYAFVAPCIVCEVTGQKLGYTWNGLYFANTIAVKEFFNKYIKG